MPEKLWKAVERKVATFFGVHRNPYSGKMSRQTASDSLHPVLFIETKLKKKHAAITLWDDTKAKSLKEKKIPVIALVEKGRPGFWIMCHSSDLKKVAEEVE